MAGHHHHHEHNGNLSRKLGMSLSILCSIHCLAMPFVIALLPMAGGFLHDPLIEGLLLGSSILLAAYFFTKDFRKGHNNVIPLVLLGIGFLIVILAFLRPGFHMLSPLGGIIIFGGYVVNWYSTRKFASCRH